MNVDKGGVRTHDPCGSRESKVTWLKSAAITTRPPCRIRARGSQKTSLQAEQMPRDGN